MALGGDKRIRWWTEAEDDQLRQLVAQHGTNNWAYISQYIPGRDGKSCRLRWTNQIAPEIDHAPFTSYEDAKIVEEYVKLGNRWAAIARLLQGRTENSVKNRWHSCLKHRARGTLEGARARASARARGTLEGFGEVDGKVDWMAGRRCDDEIGRARSEVLSPSGSSTNRSRRLVLNPVVSGDEAQSPSGSETGSSNAVEGNNFDVGADDPLTNLSLWLPYERTYKKRRTLGAHVY